MSRQTYNTVAAAQKTVSRRPTLLRFVCAAAMPATKL